MLGSLFNKVVGLQAWNYIKTASNTRVPVKLAKIFNNIFFEKHLQTAASLSRLLGWVKVKKITERSSQS